MQENRNNIIRRRLIRSYLLSVVTISLVLLLMGIIGIVGANAHSVSDWFKHSVPVSVILHNNVEETRALELCKSLSELEYVTDAEYISKERGQEQMEELLGEDFLKVFESSPIPISIELKVKPQYVQTDSLATIRSVIAGFEGVEEVSYQQSLVEALNANLRRIGLVVLAVALVLLLISSALISNTVRLNIFDKRFSVDTMRLVGATKRFIRRPFVHKAFWQGLISGLLADGLLLLALRYASGKFPQLPAVFDRTMILYILGGLLVLGVLICTMSTRRAVNRLVSLSKDELYY